MSLPAELRPGEVLPIEILRQGLAGCGKGVRVFRGCRIVGGDRVRIGDYSQIDEQVFVFGGEGVEIGRHVHLAVGSSILGGGWCEIGDFAGIAAGVRLVTGTEETAGMGLTNPTIPVAYRSVRRGRVTIGAHAVVFTASVVLPDVTIGEGAVVAAGSVVHHDLKPWGIYAGNPLTQVGVRASEAIRELAGKLRAEEER